MIAYLIVVWWAGTESKAALKFVKNKFQLFKHPPLFEELGERASKLQSRFVNNRDQLSKPLLRTFSETDDRECELGGINVNSHNPCKIMLPMNY
jgi:hypothetical protein